MISKKFRNFLIVIYALIFIIIVIGTSYAWFIALRVSSVSPEINAKSATMTTLYFEIERPLIINAYPDIFEKNMDNLISTTKATANLEVDSDNDNLEVFKYDVLLEIEKNNLEYVTASKKAELILTVIDPLGNEVTEINGLNYVSDGELKGFDITEAKNSYCIAKSYEISTKNTIKHEWNVKITLVNLDTIQDNNINKNFKGVLKFQKES